MGSKRKKKAHPKRWRVEHYLLAFVVVIFGLHMLDEQELLPLRNLRGAEAESRSPEISAPAAAVQSAEVLPTAEMNSFETQPIEVEKSFEQPAGEPAFEASEERGLQQQEQEPAAAAPASTAVAAPVTTAAAVSTASSAASSTTSVTKDSNWMKYYKSSIQLSLEQIKLIMSTLKEDSNFLVFGLGYDSPMWDHSPSTKGRTLFLENSREWIAKVTADFPTLDVEYVDYQCLMTQAFTRYYNSVDALMEAFPSYLQGTKWDVILVDSPMGGGGVGNPGRMKPIYWASQIVKPGGHVFVHDVDRDIENRFSNKFLTQALGRPRTTVKDLAYFPPTGSSPVAAPKLDATELAVLAGGAVADWMKYYKSSIQLSLEQIKLIMSTLKEDSNFLVFGLGYDSPMWAHSPSTKGRTLFLENSREWIAKVTADFPTLDVEYVDYQCLMTQAFTKYYNSVDALMEAFPSYLQGTKWDVILVDSPMGGGGVGNPGRMKPIYWASQIVKPGGHVFVHDVDRNIENRFSRKFLADALGRPRTVVKDLAYFAPVPGALNLPAVAAPASTAVAAPVTTAAAVSTASSAASSTTSVTKDSNWMKYYKSSIQLSLEQIKLIMSTLKEDSNFLVFGLGYDSPMWDHSPSTKGRTLFLENSREWIAKVTADFPTLDVEYVDYQCLMTQAFTRYYNSVDALMEAFPSYLQGTKWDVILVDSPMGGGGVGNPGRMKPIYWASQIVKPGGHVFVHDVDRDIENRFSNKFLTQALGRPRTTVKDLAYFPPTGSSPVAAPKLDATELAVLAGGAVADWMKYYKSSIQLSLEQIKLIMSTLKEDSNFLVFGLGYDSPMWDHSPSTKGRTLFLENSREWIAKVTADFPTLDVEYVDYQCLMTQAFTKYYNSVDALMEAFPSYLQGTKWDVILVDSPMGGGGVGNPGRMKPIYWASQIVKPGGHVFVHDVDRNIENRFSRKFLADALGRPRTVVKDLAYFAPPVV